MLLWGDISAVPFSPKKCWLCWIKTWMHNVNTARGGGEGGKDATFSRAITLVSQEFWPGLSVRNLQYSFGK